MAAGPADFVIQIVKETALVFNFTKDFQWLKKKLTILRSSLQHADGQSTQDDSVKEWIQSVRDIAFDAEDIIEEYGVESLYSDSTSTQSCGCSYRQLLFRYNMGRRIRDIKDRMRSVIEDAGEMNILQAVPVSQQAAPSASSSTSQTELWRRSSVLEWDARPVAVDDKVEEIVSLLENAEVSLIAAVGMGGVGKAFLMQNVYQKVQHMFEICVWLSISQMYSVRQLQSDLAFEIERSERVGQSEKSRLKRVYQSGISCSEAQSLSHSILEGRNFLIVLDDVWKPFQEEDLIRNLGLPCENKSSWKIVVTTRNKQIFSNMNMNNVQMYEIRPLRQEYSWELFCAYAFSDCLQNRPPPHLEKLSHEVESECAGLPLAIKTVASSMANTRSPRDWELKVSKLKEVRTGHDDPIMQILKLSYDLLPAALKSCFAYLSFFPEDHVIDCQYLIYLWAAEGFLHARGNEDELEFGWGYLSRLANLCLIEVWEVEDIFEESRKKCKVHDLVLDFAVHTCRDTKCAFAVEEAFEEGNRLGCRRILLAKKGIDNNAITERNAFSLRCVRTLSLYNNPIRDNVAANLFSHVRVLRVLDLSRTNISTLPECVGNLKLLRVLNLSETNIRQLPECVAKLKSLRFLDVSYCGDLVELPAWIGELTSLQHLNIQVISARLKDRIPPKGISKLLSLRELKSYYPLKLSIGNENELLKLEDLRNLTELREILIEVKHPEEIKMLEQGILVHMVHMRFLQISNMLETANEAEQMPFPFAEAMKAMKDLEQVYLFSFALSRENKRCRELPKAFGKSTAFPKLRILFITAFDVLEEFWKELEDGAMASLETLTIMWCSKIKNVPHGLERLKSLKAFTFVKSGTEKVRERLKAGREVWSKIKANNPRVSVSI